MTREFRGPREGEQPTEGGLDELLADPPDTPVIGSLTAYRDGSRARRWVYGGLLVGVVGAVVAGRWYVQYLEDERYVPPPEYQLAEGAENEVRPDVLVWDTGVARLGLSRTDPGVKAIVLPDRIVTLAPGCDHAQIKVNVVDGETVGFKVLLGEVRQKKREPTSDGS